MLSNENVFVWPRLSKDGRLDLVSSVVQFCWSFEAVRVQFFGSRLGASGADVKEYELTAAGQFSGSVSSHWTGRLLCSTHHFVFALASVVLSMDSCV